MSWTRLYTILEAMEKMLDYQVELFAAVASDGSGKVVDDFGHVCFVFNDIENDFEEEAFNWFLVGEWGEQ